MRPPGWGRCAPRDPPTRHRPRQPGTPLDAGTAPQLHRPARRPTTRLPRASTETPPQSQHRRTHPTPTDAHPTASPKTRRLTCYLPAPPHWHGPGHTSGPRGRACGHSAWPGGCGRVRAGSETCSDQGKRDQLYIKLIMGTRFPVRVRVRGRACARVGAGVRACALGGRPQRATLGWVARACVGGWHAGHAGTCAGVRTLGGCWQGGTLARWDACGREH